MINGRTGYKLTFAVMALIGVLLVAQTLLMMAGATPGELQPIGFFTTALQAFVLGALGLNVRPPGGPGKGPGETP